MAKAKTPAKSRAKGTLRRKGSSKPRAGGTAPATKPKTTGKRSGTRDAAPSRSTRPKAGSLGSGKGTIGKSGEGLDGGVARLQAGDPGAIGTRPTASNPPTPRKAKRQLPHEKAVRDTDRTFGVAPERPAPGEREPMPAEALDRRRQIVGTDEPRGSEPGDDAEDTDAMSQT